MATIRPKYHHAPLTVIEGELFFEFWGKLYCVQQVSPLDRAIDPNYIQPAGDIRLIKPFGVEYMKRWLRKREQPHKQKWASETKSDERYR